MEEISTKLTERVSNRREKKMSSRVLLTYLQDESKEGTEFKAIIGSSVHTFHGLAGMTE